MNGKVALVTAANRGIGAAIASELVREGVYVCPVARDSDKTQEIADRPKKMANIDVPVFSAERRDHTAPRQAIAAAVGQFGHLDRQVNNAGANERADFFAQTEEDWRDGFALKFHGHVRVTRAAWQHLREATGSIVNSVGIGSRAGFAEFTIGGLVNVALLNSTKATDGIGTAQGVRVSEPTVSPAM
jgi:3-oxoacyl-[acyl-carrier protein] reductase